ncbi:MAG: type II toxin-antitoxin system VapC family toxin [Haloarculaceae archaeon]
MIEDTSFLVDVLGGDEAALDALTDIEADRKPEKVSSITVLELYEGVERADRPDDEVAEVIDVLDSKTVVPADHDVMRHAGRISGTLYADGRPIDREDCIVAATALQEDEPVVTRNAGHFERVDGLDVKEY